MISLGIMTVVERTIFGITTWSVLQLEAEVEASWL